MGTLFGGQCRVWTAASLLLAAVVVVSGGKATASKAQEPERIAAGPEEPRSSEASSPDRARPLPFRRPDSTSSSPAERPDVKRLWQLYGITESDWQAFDDQPTMNSVEQAILLRVLFRLGQLSFAELESMAVPTDDLDNVLENVSAHRGRMVFVSGVVESAQAVPLGDQEQAAFGFAEWYRVRLRTPRHGTLELASRSVPQVWLSAGELSERVRTVAVLLEGKATGAGLWRAASLRLQWYPNQPNAALGIAASHVLLAGHGMDASFWEILRKSNGRPLTKDDREPFYSALQAAADIRPNNIEPSYYAKFDLAKILQEPELHQGNYYSFIATARRVSRIAVEDNDIRERYHLTEYYEIDIMIPLGDVPVRLKTDKNDEGPIYEHRYPATVCALSVPVQLQRAARNAAAGGSDAPLINQTVRVQGVFLKIWAYPSEYVSSLAPGQLHPSPLFVASSVELVSDTQVPRNDRYTWVFAGAIILGLLVIVYAAWRRW